nr:MAG TPA: hypothetical protein [Caudoviricetes sp.]
MSIPNIYLLIKIFINKLINTFIFINLVHLIFTFDIYN